MCLAIPTQLLTLHSDDTAEVLLDGSVRKISTAMLNAPQVGDYVIVHAGIAMEKLTPEEASEILASIAQATMPAAR